MRHALVAFADEPPAVLANWIAQVADPSRPSAVLLLGDPGVPLDSLRKAKDLFKLMRVLGHEAPLRRMGHRLYAATIAAAIVHHDARISHQSDRALSRALHFLLKDDGVPEVIRRMVQAASDRLPRVRESLINFDQGESLAIPDSTESIAPVGEGEDFHVPSLMSRPRDPSLTDDAELTPSNDPVPEPLPVATAVPRIAPPPRRRRVREPIFRRHIRTSRAFCPSCGEVVEVQRRIPNRPAHLWASILTAGLWFVPWGLIELNLCLTRWRCIDCHRGLPSSLLT